MLAVGPHQILLPPPDSIDHSKLQEGEEDEAGAGQEPNVNEFHIVHLQNMTGVFTVDDDDGVNDDGVDDDSVDDDSVDDDSVDDDDDDCVLWFVHLRKLIRARVPGESDHGQPGGGAQSGPPWDGVWPKPE